MGITHFCATFYIGSVLSAVKACLIIVGARPTASQLVACIVMSLSYQP